MENRFMRTRMVAGLGLALLQALGGQPARAQVKPFPPGFHSQRIATNGTTLYVRTGGSGPPVVLLHGYGETGDMWSALAAKLAPTIRSSFPISGAWVTRPVPAAG